MGNSFVIYSHIFPPCIALQSPSLPRVSGLGGGTLEFGARQTSYFLAEPAKAFEDEEGMERRGDVGMLRTPAGCRSAFPAAAEYFAGGADVSQPGRKTASSPKELDSGETKRERKGWKKRPSRGPMLPPLPFASSRGDSDGGRGFCTGVCMRRPKCLMSHGVWGEVAVTWPWWHGCGKPSMCQGTGTSPKLKEKHCICCLPLEFKPLLHLHFNNRENEQHFKLSGVVFQISFPFSPHLQAICGVLT